MSSKTCTAFYHIDTRQVLVASLGSSTKNSFAVHIYFLPWFPLRLHIPFLIHFDARQFSARSSTVAFGAVLKPLALNLNVSFLTIGTSLVTVYHPALADVFLRMQLAPQRVFVGCNGNPGTEGQVGIM